MITQRRRDCPSWIIVLGALVLIPQLAMAQDYHPLDVGAQWLYHSSFDGDQTMTIVGEREVFGVTTRIRNQAEQDQIYENFWSKDAHGNLFLHGAQNLTVDFEVAYLPPIQMVSAPLYLGKVWATEGIQLYDLDGTPWGYASFDYPVRVYTEGVISVPAGDYYAYGVGYDVGPGIVHTRNGETFDLLGRRLADSRAVLTDNATDWYSIGIGLVLFTDLVDEELGFKLVSHDSPVPAVPLSWGSIRAKFAR